MDLVTLILACSLYKNNSIPYAVVQISSKNSPLLVTVNNHSKQFKSEFDANNYIQSKIAQGKKVDIGLMQISSQWLPEINLPANSLLRPCKNVVVATQLMNRLYLHCQNLAASNPTLNISTCMLSMYKTGNSKAGIPFANKIITFAAKHPFTLLAEKARYPGMLAAAVKPKIVVNTIHEKNC